MPGTGDQLARLLAEVKSRSGLSYSELSKQTHTSTSTLHRYCTGKTVPPDYQTVARIAMACSATDSELTELLRLWRQARSVENADPVVPKQPSVRRRIPLGSVALSLLTVVLLLSAVAGAPTGPVSEANQQVYGPSWARQEPVDPTMFGVTASSSSGVMPSFRVGSLRFWDSRTRWASIQPQRDVYDWSILDRLVDSARHAGLPAMFVFGGTPAWAAPTSPKAAYNDGSRAAPPDDLADWDRFVSAVAARYRGRLDAYELWAYGNDGRYYAGSTEALVEMTRRASLAIKAADPDVTVVCPSMGRLWTADGLAFLRRFAELGGYQHCDVAGIKLHQRRAADPPETTLELLGHIDETFHAAGAHPRLWNTGTTYEHALEKPLTEQRTIDYAVRFYLVAIYGTNKGLNRSYFYNWGGGGLPITLQVVGGPPTRAALAVEELQRWLAGTRTRGCEQGPSINLPVGVWQCAFTAKDGRVLLIQWTSDGAAQTFAPNRSEELRLIDGTSRPLQPGEIVHVTQTPQLIVQGPGD
ncbi:helix-turn-helix domain-containing protein [Kibdelosporangium persicum]|uniref:Beta-galactosidase n=1 Tax=Kibdelosporangium persicum TaxID=2698649 RepID=A0ABX2FE10_9PSEU|nr:Beta-galactosidase [Kibdelosporangium persicum]